MKKLTAKEYDFSTVNGLTKEQLSNHYKLYNGYVTNLNKIDDMNKEFNNYLNSNPTFSEMRSLKLGESYSYDGIKLHELYFENITNGNDSISPKLKDLITNQWGSIDNFIGYLKQVCLSMRGWGIVCYDFLTESIRITGSDLHDQGAFWCALPLLVIDVYEHAYFMDFGADRDKYLDTIFKNLNWEVISSRLNTHIK